MPRRPSQPTPRPKPKTSVVEVKTWDFSSHEGVDRVAMVALRQVGENFSRLLANRLTVLVRTRATVDLRATEQLGWEDFEAKVGGPGLLATFSLGEGQVFVHLPAGLCLSLIDLYLAGTGAGPFPNRQLSETERQLLAPFLSATAGGLADAASSVFGEVHAGPVTLVTGISGLFLSNRRMPCVAMWPSVQLPTSKSPVGEIGMCLPIGALRPLVAKLQSTGPAKGSQAPALAAALSVPLTLSLRYPPVTVPLDVVKYLAPGQVLNLGHLIGEPLTLYAGDKELFAVQPVEHARRAACEIVEAKGGAL